VAVAASTPATLPDSGGCGANALSRVGSIDSGPDAHGITGMRPRLLPVRLPGVPRGSVARNLVVVGAGTALGQGATVIAAPVLARLYDPQAFGLLSVYAAVLSVLVAIASLRFDFAIPIAANPDEAAHLLALSVILALGASLLVGFVVLVWGAQIAAALGAASLAPFLWLLPIALFAASVTQALASWAVYRRLFPALGRLRAVQGVALAGCQLLLGFVRAGTIGLIVGDVAGRIFGTGQLFRSLFDSVRSTELTLTSVWRSARDRWGFARVMTVASLLSAVSLQVPFLLIPSLFDLESSGQYFLAYRVLVLPGSLVAAAVSQVFFGEASLRRAEPQRLHDLAHNVAVSLFVFSIPTYGIVMVGGPALFEAVFGSTWGPAGFYAQIMAPSLVVWSVASPISSLPLVGRRERESLAFTAAELGLRACSLGFGAIVHSLTAGLVALSVTALLLNVAALWRFLRVASVTLRELVLPAGRIAALTVPFMGMIVLAGQMASGAVPPVSIVGWAVALGLAARFSPEITALVSGAHD
jgi:O-antigen/teichoic acid export membrane protein